MQPRDLRIPAERDVGLGAAADRHRARGVVQPDDQLRAAVVAQQQERIPALLRLAAGVEVVGRGEVEGERRVHQREKMFSSETKMFTTDTKMPVASQTASASVPCLRM